MSVFLPQNPGIGGLDELTLSEEEAVQTIAALGSPGQFLRTNLAGTGVEWTTSGSGVTTFLDLTDTPATFAGQSLKVVRVNVGETGLEFATIGGSGTVTDVSVVTANGISGSVATSTTTPAITLSLGNITPSGVLVSGLTASEIVITDASKNLASAAVATYPSLTELSYVKGVTSAIQTQLNAKGTGNVTKVDTPVDNQVGVWTGDGTLEGDNALTFDTTTKTLAVTSTDGGAVGPIVELYHNSASPTGSDIIGEIRFSGEDTASNKDTYASIKSIITTAASTSESAILDFFTINAGTLSSRMYLDYNVLAPSTNNGLALGNTLRQFSDLFLAEGGVINWDNGDATLTQVGDVVTLAGADLKISSPGNVTTSVATVDATQTLTNKRVTKRTDTTTSSATPTINTDNVDEYYITAQAVAITSMTTNLSGTPTLGQGLFISITGTAARAITWGASFANGPVALPTTTVTTTALSVYLRYDGTIWRCMATGSTV